jgi:hypothetical protein
MPNAGLNNKLSLAQWRLPNANCRLPLATSECGLAPYCLAIAACRLECLVPHWSRPKVRIDQSAFANRQSEIVTAIGNRQSLDTLLVKLVND